VVSRSRIWDESRNCIKRIGRPAEKSESWDDDEKCRGWYTFEELEGLSSKF